MAREAKNHFLKIHFKYNSYDYALMKPGKSSTKI